MERLTQRFKEYCVESKGFLYNPNFTADELSYIIRLLDLEEQGLLLRLPCKVGDTVWIRDRDGQPQEMILDPPDIRCHCAKEDSLCMALCDRKNTGVCAYRFKNDGSDIGKTVFLTQAEAEEALMKMKESED